jgi:hypothetical protein
MDYEKSTGNYVATPQEAEALGNPEKTSWTPGETGELIDSAASAATRLAHTDLSVYPLSADGMSVRFKYEIDVRRIGGVLRCLKENSSLSDNDYEGLLKGLSF